MKGLVSLRKLAVAVAVCMAVLCLPGYSEPTPEQIAERTRLLLKAVENDDVEWVKLLINHGAYVNARVGHGETILMYAISRDVADVLIKAGADVNAKDHDGKTALMVIATEHSQMVYYRKLNNVAELLIKSGADVNAKDNKGWTALKHASSNGCLNFKELLLAAGAKE